MPSRRIFLSLILTLLAAVILAGVFIFRGSDTSTPPVAGTFSSLEEGQVPASPGPSSRGMEPVAEKPAADKAETGAPVDGVAQAGANAPDLPDAGPSAPLAPKRAVISTYYSDAFIPMKWRNLPDSSPLKQLVQQVALPRSATFQPSSDRVQTEQALREAASQIPAAFTQEAPDESASETTVRQTSEIQDQFIEEISKIKGKPTEADYQRQWRIARLRADSLFIAMFGQATFNARQMALLKNPESN